MIGSFANLGQLIRQQRISQSLTLTQLAGKSRLSPSHLGRIEKGERLPSAHTLRKLAPPLGFQEGELFTLAGFLSPERAGDDARVTSVTAKLDPYVVSVLSQEPVEVQRTVIGILSILKSLSKAAFPDR